MTHEDTSRLRAPVAKVARWDAARGAYVAHDSEGDVCMVATERERAIAWGYTIEGGPAEDSPERLPARCGDCKHYDGDRLCKASTGQRFTWGSYEPASWCPLRFAAKADDTAPERLKARREALGWSMTDAALVLGGACDERDIGHYEAHDDACCMPLRTAYAAALSAAEDEARRAAKPEPVRFQLGDLVRVHKVVGSTVPMTALAQRLVAHPRWRWEPGMMGYLSGGVREPILAPLTGLHPSLALDIEHPATKGWLLAMLRRATGTQDVCAAWVGSSWRLYGWIGASALGRFANEGEALASALLAVWGAP